MLCFTSQDKELYGIDEDFIGFGQTRLLMSRDAGDRFPGALRALQMCATDDFTTVAFGKGTKKDLQNKMKTVRVRPAWKNPITFQNYEKHSTCFFCID